MRTEVKVGLVIALVLVVVGLWFFVFRGEGDRQPAEKPPEQAAQQPGQGEPRMAVVERSREEPAQEPAPAAPGSEAAEVPLTYSPGVGTGTPAETPAESAAAEESPAWWETAPPPSRVTPTRTGAPSTPAATTWTPATSQERTYRVKSGDTYWGIAKSEYGDATLYKLLVAANPNIPPKSLAAGMTVKIPSRPEKSATVETARPAAEGTTLVDVDAGRRYYVVKKGDNGFWGVSIAAFNTPNRWKEIEALNPGVNARSLKPGQKLLLPEGAVAATAERTAPARLAAAKTPRGWSGSGAPSREARPDGRLFD